MSGKTKSAQAKICLRRWDASIEDCAPYGSLAFLYGRPAKPHSQHRKFYLLIEILLKGKILPFNSKFFQHRKFPGKSKSAQHKICLRMRNASIQHCAPCEALTFLYISGAWEVVGWHCLRTEPWHP